MPQPRGAEQTNPPAPPRLRYIGALDGIRALAVVAVVLYHAELPWLPIRFSGGFLGVDVFFVLSGFLITSLLLVEWGGSGRTTFRAFWLRRARRLLPAVFILLLAVMAFAVIFLPDEVASLRGDALSAVLYITNWRLIFNHVSYFQSWGRPSLFRHLWSLAIEEQFYIVWPLVFVAGIRWLKPRGFALLVLLLALASAALMAALYQPGADPSRVYYGTGTRSAGLLVGSALALVWRPGKAQRPRIAALGDLVGISALAGLGAMMLLVDDSSDLLYRGGFLLAAVATAALIAVVVSPTSSLGNLLSWTALRRMGKRSYSIYLWHWPVLMLTRPGIDTSMDGPALFLIQIAIIAVSAELSYRFVETPVRRGALGRLWAAARERGGRLAPRAAAYGGAAAMLCACLTVGAFTWQAHKLQLPAFASISGPAPNVLRRLEPAGAPTATPAVPQGNVERATAASAVVVPATSVCRACVPPAPTVAEKPTRAPPAPSPSPTSPHEQPSVTAVGDSVMLGASPQLYEAIPNLQIYAEVGLQASRGFELVGQLKEEGALGDIVILHLGNNGDVSESQLTGLLDLLSDRERVVLVNLKVGRPWQDPNNAKFAGLQAGHRNVVVADWQALSKDHPEYFWDDGIHLRPEGAQVYAALLLEALGEPGVVIPQGP